MKIIQNSYFLSVVFGALFSYFIWEYSTENNVVIEDQKYIYSEISSIENLISEINILPDIPKLSISWDRLSSLSKICNTDLKYLSSDNLSNIPLYSGVHNAWHGILKGEVSDVLSVIYYISAKIPIEFYQVTIQDGQAEVYLSVLGAY